VGGRAAAVSDCLNFGNPEKPEVMWQFSRAVDGMSAACRAFETPVISGNVSFYNDNQGESIPPTPVVAMVGLVADDAHFATAGFKVAGEAVYLLGAGVPTLEGSEYLYQRHGLCGDRPPPIDLDGEIRTSRLCATAIEHGWVRTAHDVSDGGLAVALAEMCLAGSGIGCAAEITFSGRVDRALFGESGCRILVTLPEELAFDFEETAREAGVPAVRIGTTGGVRMVVDRVAKAGTEAPLLRLIDVSLERLREGWEATLPAIARGRRT
jgi:phosphoribosylformylglycinamidine synthase